MMGVPGKWPWKKGSVDGHVLDSHDALPRLHSTIRSTGENG